MRQIIPAIITSDENPDNDFKELKAKFEKLEPFLAEFDNWVQIDITDGKFVPTKTDVDLEDLRYFTERANVEFHLMIDRPEEVIGEWARLGSKRIIFHIEAAKDPRKIIDICDGQGIEIGLAINPETAVTLLEPWINSVDLIMFMGVHPGRGGQEFIPEVLDKIKWLRWNFPDVKIEIDGGVRIANIDELKSAGVDVFVIGSGILRAPDVKGALDELKEKIFC